MDVKLPNLGEGTDSGTVVSVLVKEGASVKKGQNVIELETGKAVAPIPSPSAGVVKGVKVREGDKLSVGQVILVLESADAEPSAGRPAAAGITKAPAKPPPAPGAPRQPARSAAPPTFDGGQADAVEEIVNPAPVAGPYARKIAHELAIDLQHVAGSGPSGQVTVADLRDYIARLRALAHRPAAAAAAPAGPAKAAAVLPDFAAYGPIVKRPLTPLRRTIAERMVDSATTLPAVTQFDEVDVTHLNDLRKRHAPAYEAKGARLTMTSFVLKAVAATLRKHPLFNTSLDEAAGEIVFKEYIHLGLAVDTEAGLLVPVIRDADKKDLVQLSKDIQEAAAKARDRKLSLADMQGGTFTISNQGGIGGAHFTPIINKPEAAILGLGRSVLKPVVRDGQIVPRLMMPVALTYDHRLIDGGAAARFTVDLVAAFESLAEADIKP
jgi:pyruvate dehydrogenase E2 component (dihydrolipoamide acetyltransferase)